MKTLKELKIELKELQQEHEFETTNFLKNNYNLQKIEEDIDLYLCNKILKIGLLLFYQNELE